MPRIASFRRLGAIVLLAAVSACSKTDAAPASQQVSASGGDVTATAAPPAGTAPKDSISTLADRGRIRGAASAPIWLVEISDFQCPYCKRWHDESFLSLDKEYVQTGKVRLAYLNFPIPSLHPNARAASEAAMCASVQGKFWELHESLFNTQAKWASEANPMPTFDSLATAAGVDAPKWRSCIAAHSTVALIDADQQRSKGNGVQSTPTFYIGDERLEGAYPLDSFRVAINRQLAKARGAR